MVALNFYANTLGAGGLSRGGGGSMRETGLCFLPRSRRISPAAETRSSAEGHLGQWILLITGIACKILPSHVCGWVGERTGEEKQ